MPEPPKAAPVPAWVFGQLTTEEETALMSRALEDPALFDELLAANEDRELLQNPAYRNRLKRAVQAPATRSVWSAAWQWLNRPVSRLALAGVMAVAVAFLIWRGGGGEDGFKEREASIVTGPATGLDTFFTLPLRSKLNAPFDLNRTTAEFHPGEVVRASLRLRAPASVFVLRRQPGGQVRMVFPGGLLASSELPAGSSEIVFDPLPPTTDVTARESVLLRVLALPSGTDLRRGSIDWAKLKAYSIQEVTYYVAP